MDTIFGTEFPLLVKFVISFAVVLILIGVAAFLLRRFGPKALARSTSLGRQPRLAVVESAPIDDRRNLVIVRRDNVEHLLLIGGPTDLLVEPNISQSAVQPAREPEMAARPVPGVAPNWTANTNWPPAPAPEVVARAEPPQKAEPRIEVRSEPPVRSEPAIMPEPFPRAEPRIQTVPAFESSVVIPAAKTVAPPTNTAHLLDDASHVPPVVAQVQDLDAHRDRMIGAAATPAADPSPPLQPVAQRTAARAGENPFNDDQNLADMAQRLEAALRRPLAGNTARAIPQAAPPVTAPARQNMAQSPAPAVTIAPAPSAPQAAPTVVSPAAPPPARDENGSYETLQREMASLLGRKPGSS
ncbi:MAG: flagellar biosynthetic protein FliO [Xanthobacteraceae bacterium]